jgi:hypothetical protein
MQASTVVSGTPSDADIQFQINLLLNLMRARAAGGKVYATLLGSSVTPSSRKRSTNNVWALSILFSLVLSISLFSLFIINFFSDTHPGS